MEKKEPSGDARPRERASRRVSISMLSSKSSNCFRSNFGDYHEPVLIVKNSLELQVIIIEPGAEEHDRALSIEAYAPASMI